MPASYTAINARVANTTVTLTNIAKTKQFTRKFAASRQSTCVAKELAMCVVEWYIVVSENTDSTVGRFMYVAVVVVCFMSLTL